MARALLVVDPQCDFINGSLQVPGAEKAMNALTRYVREHNQKYALKIVTCDFHPYWHNSFKEKGGNWPRHCVAHSPGAAIWPELHDALNLTGGELIVTVKGDQPEREEYSIFQNDLSKELIMNRIANHEIDAIDICGLAGDVCVLNTLKDGAEIFGREKFTLLRDFSPSLDDGSLVDEFCKQGAICVR